eukprot:Sspe_Gene.66394::Locus_39233_Transcript_1_1_Confidence_1.000_Length_1047::g.66394::m.66394/K01291/CPB1; carboxypeptidase B
MGSCTLALLTMCALAVASDYANHYRVTSVVEVQKLLELIAQHDELNVLHTHPINRTTVAVELLQTKQEIDRIGLNVKVVGKRGEVQDAIEAERRLPRAPLNFSKNNFFDSYRTWEEIEAQTGYLLLNNPSLLTNSQLGTTVEGRPIPIIRMSASRDPRPGFYIQCLVHAREWLAGPFCVYVLETMTAAYAAGDPGVRRILNNMAIWVVPVLNIDGYDYTWNGNRLWRKNRSFNSGGSRGVDLNRNYDIQWGTTGVSHSPSSDNYCGPSACSEPECKAVTEFMKNHPEVIGAWDMHICGPYILYPWDYTASHGVPQPDRATYEGLAHELNK